MLPRCSSRGSSGSRRSGPCSGSRSRMMRMPPCMVLIASLTSSLRSRSTRLLELHTHVHQRRGEEVDGEFLVGHELNGAVYGTLVLGVSTLNLQQTSDGRLEVGLGRRGGREGRRGGGRGERGVRYRFAMTGGGAPGPCLSCRASSPLALTSAVVLYMSIHKEVNTRREGAREEILLSWNSRA